MSVRITEDDFDIALEHEKLKSLDSGAIVTFTGTVRDLPNGGGLNAMTLEHYPGMTEKALEDIERQAQARWPLEGSLIVHRYGRLEPGDDIVLVIAAAAHRQDAFDACQFLMDWLKTKAPFWKLESGDGGEEWVAARDSDDDAAERWTRSYTHK